MREPCVGQGKSGLRLSCPLRNPGNTRVVRRLAVGLLVLALTAFGGALWWLEQPLALRQAVVDLKIAPGMAARQVALQAVSDGVQTSPWALYAWFRLSGQARRIQAGTYELTAGLTPRALLSKLVKGERAERQVTLLEGWTFAQIQQALASAADLQLASGELSSAALMAKLGRQGQLPEGRFFPDTYRYPKGGSDLEVLSAALQAMDRQLEQAWSARTPDSVLRDPGELLILASIVEKETGLGADRPLVAGVFHNRLKRGMPLQTDPTVIYGMGEAFDGNLRRRDLQKDTPWNTYTRVGLPPTPIAMPGQASLMAAARPAQTKALYFVARGDGSSEFSETLEAHNRAVNRYQRRQQPKPQGSERR